MLGMLVGHAGDVENDAGDVDGLVCNASISGQKQHFIGPDEKTKKKKEQHKKKRRTIPNEIRTQMYLGDND